MCQTSVSIIPMVEANTVLSSEATTNKQIIMYRMSHLAPTLWPGPGSSCAQAVDLHLGMIATR